MPLVEIQDRVMRPSLASVHRIAAMADVDPVLRLRMLSQTPLPHSTSG